MTFATLRREEIDTDVDLYGTCHSGTWGVTLAPGGDRLAFQIDVIGRVPIDGLNNVINI